MKRCLFVDDEQLLVELLQIGFQCAGIPALSATSGKQALELCKQYGSEISVVISDITMPNMTGWELIKEIRQINPAARLVVLTASYDENPPEGLVVDKIFRKGSFESKDLVQSVKGLLDKGV